MVIFNILKPGIAINKNLLIPLRPLADKVLIVCAAFSNLLPLLTEKNSPVFY